MAKKYLIIGGVAGGASVAARLRRLDERAEITMLERGRDVSFSNCALPYFIGGDIGLSGELILVSPDTFWQRYRIRARTLTEAAAIDRENKTVLARNLQTGQEETLPYDALFLSPGASPIMPASLPGISLPHVFSVRNVVDVERIDAYLKDHAVREAAVIGGGFIGLEMAENLRHRGLEVTVADMAPQVMLPFDRDMAQFLHKEVLDHGVALALGDGLMEIHSDHVTLASGREIPAQVVIMAIGVRPETALATGCGLEIGPTGGIKVDGAMRTSDPSIYAVGDAAELVNFQTGKPCRLPLAGPALRQARHAATAQTEEVPDIPGVLGSSVIRVFGLTAASTGMNGKALRDAGIDYGVSFVVANDIVGIMPGASPIFLKLFFEKTGGKVLGAQAIGQGAAEKRIDVIATAVRFGASVHDLKDLDLCYSPLYSTARDPVNQAALQATNLLEGKLRQVLFSQVRELAEKGEYLLDVRETDEYTQGHVKGSKNIPLSQLRERMDEIPRDHPVYVFCRSGARSYNASRAMMQEGIDAYNIAGSFLALSWHEYYQDQTFNREPIVTGYNFE
ncbi:MAG: FAD-dependent oxidoreductase [Eubacteriales bacterium]|nr:FAD-dependent oxidoreductase [Eubacteriales bacterium]